MQTLILIRHGDIGDAYTGRLVGRGDMPLSALGRTQAEGLGHRFRSSNISCLLSSPLSRAQETAEAVAHAAQCPVTTHEDLAEVDFGDWEGKTFDEIETAAPERIDHWAKFDPTFAFPKGESLACFLERIERLASHIASLQNETVVAVTHGGVIRALICVFLGLDPRNYVLFEVSRGSITTLKLFGERGVLTGLNEGMGE
jgi:alpha-ribazole phosphatase